MGLRRLLLIFNTTISRLSLGIALISTVGLRLLSMISISMSFSLVALGIALISTVGLRRLT